MDLNEKNIVLEVENNDKKENTELQNLPDWKLWVEDDRWNEIIENGEISQNKIIEKTKKETNSLKNSLKLESVNWISTKLKKYIKPNWELINVSKLRLDEIIHRWQKLRLKRGNNISSIIWWKSNNWEMTFINEKTKRRAIIRDWDIILPYNEQNKKNEKNNSPKEKIISKKVPKNIKSAPSYRSANWVTLCSRTARENLQKLGIKNIKQWSSAKASFEMYWKKAETFPPKDKNANVFDFYCDASPKNRHYWHRAVWVKINWKWNILDPYYNWTTSPVSAENYVSKMRQRWRRIWWWFTVA